MMNLQESISPTGGAPRLTADAQCLLSITDSLKSSGQILGLLNLAISNPRTTIPEIATILRRDVMLSAQPFTPTKAAPPCVKTGSTPLGLNPCN